MVECSSDTPQFVLWKLNHIADESCSSGNETESCQSSQSGTMSALSTESRGKEGSMSSAEASPAKTSALQGGAKESREKEAACGQKWQGSLAKYDPNTSLWKTAQCSFLGEWDECLEIFPKWGIMLNGELWELAMLEGTTNDYECGLSETYPTPTRRDTQGPRGKAAQARKGNPMDTLPNVVGGVPHPRLSEWLLGWPLGWTGLEQLEMDNLQSWRQHHSNF